MPTRPNGQRRIPCPVHGGRDANCSLWRDARGQLRAKCWSRACTEQAILAALGEVATPLSGTTRPKHDADSSSLAARRIWDQSRAAEGTLVQRYLRGRGITISPPSSLNFHSALKHRSGSSFPAMVAAVEDLSGKFLGVQRTFLCADGSSKASVEPQKMSLGPLAGGAVRLAPTLGKIVVLTEGIEDGLSIVQSTGFVVWAALGTSGLRSVKLPDAIREVVIAADNDEPGEKAARDAAQRFLAEGRRAKIARPSKGKDFNNLLRGIA
jgi:putative DNA primase/helicase